MSAATTTAIARILIHEMMLMAFTDFLDLKYRHANNSFKLKYLVYLKNEVA